jgi:hypothetical protein
MSNQEAPARTNVTSIPPAAEPALLMAILRAKDLIEWERR